MGCQWAEYRHYSRKCSTLESYWHPGTSGGPGGMAAVNILSSSLHDAWTLTYAPSNIKGDILFWVSRMISQPRA